MEEFFLYKKGFFLLFYQVLQLEFSEENNKLAQTIVDNSLTLVKGENVKLTKDTLVIAD